MSFKYKISENTLNDATKIEYPVDDYILSDIKILISIG
jgi:hypothetical protein